MRKCIETKWSYTSVIRFLGLDTLLRKLRSAALGQRSLLSASVERRTEPAAVWLERRRAGRRPTHGVRALRANGRCIACTE
jgi:hypothetical protein